MTIRKSIGRRAYAFKSIIIDRQLVRDNLRLITCNYLLKREHGIQRDFVSAMAQEFGKWLPSINGLWSARVVTGPGSPLVLRIGQEFLDGGLPCRLDRKSTRLNSSHLGISY